MSGPPIFTLVRPRTGFTANSKTPPIALAVSFTLRTFTTTPPKSRKEVPHPDFPSPERRARHGPRRMPPYPYGPRAVYKQSNKGLYGLARIQFGNTVAEKYGNKSRRTWQPNAHRATFYSRILGRNVRTRCTVRVIRTIDKLGGSLDAYLLSNKTRRIKELGPHGWKLRWMLMRRLKKDQKKLEFIPYKKDATLRQMRRGTARKWLTRLEKMRLDAGAKWRTNGEYNKLVKKLENKARMMESRALDRPPTPVWYSEYSDTSKYWYMIKRGKKGRQVIPPLEDGDIEDVYDDPTLEAEVNHMLDNEHEFQLGTPEEDKAKPQKIT